MSQPKLSQEFVSEAIEPAAASFEADAMARGEPGLPGEFAWRGRQYRVGQVLRKWKTSTAERGEMYLRRHWFAIITECGRQMTLYCERQARSSRKPKLRWWLYSITGTFP